MAALVQASMPVALPCAEPLTFLSSKADSSKGVFEALASVKQEARNVPRPLHEAWTPNSLTGVWSTSAENIVSKGTDALKEGVLLLPDLGMTPPWVDIRSLFDFLSQNPDITAEVNSLYPLCNILKDAARDASRGDADIIDQKVAFDLNAQRLQALQNAPGLVEKLGAPLQTVLKFFQGVEEELVPKLMEIISLVSGQDLTTCHTQKNNNFRIVDYPEHQFTEGSAKERRCGMHRDFGTFTIVFPNGEGLQIEREGGYIDLPGDTPQLFFGYCGAILSNGRLHAAKHRVIDYPPDQNGRVARRSSLVLFVAPNESTPLKPAVGAGEMAKFRGGVTSTELKEAMKRKWKAREGTLGREGSADAGSQDDIIDQFMRLPEAV